MGLLISVHINICLITLRVFFKLRYIIYYLQSKKNRPMKEISLVNILINKREWGERGGGEMTTLSPCRRTCCPWLGGGGGRGSGQAKTSLC